MILRRASTNDWIEFYGKPPEWSVKALCAVMGGTIAGMTGLIYRPDMVVAFGDMKPGIGRKTLWLATQWMAGMLDRQTRQVVAIASPKYRTSAGLLRHLGFEHVGPSPDGEVYRWRKQRSR